MHGANFRMIAKTFGFEEILANELKMLGASRREQGVRMVSFKGDKGFYVQGKFVFENGF
jgi:putative N6-adenine-specific DNA methylase